MAKAESEDSATSIGARGTLIWTNHGARVARVTGSWFGGSGTPSLAGLGEGLCESCEFAVGRSSR